MDMYNFKKYFSINNVIIAFIAIMALIVVIKFSTVIYKTDYYTQEMRYKYFIGCLNETSKNSNVQDREKLVKTCGEQARLMIHN